MGKHPRVGDVVLAWKGTKAVEGRITSITPPKAILYIVDSSDSWYHTEYVEVELKDIVLITSRSGKVCECGSDTVGHPSHSWYCPAL
jgi:hypothetical protein